MSPSSYFLVRLNPPPTKITAINNRKEDYLWAFASNLYPLRCEISYLHEGSIREIREDGESLYTQGTVHSFVQNQYLRHVSNDPVVHEFYLSFHAAQPPEPIAAEKVANWFSVVHEAILPDSVTDPAVCQQIARVITSVVGLAESNQVARGLKMRTALYECLAILTEYSVLQAQASRKKTDRQRHRCTVKALDYIKEHLAEKITVSDIAKAAGDNYDHLKNAFRKDMNMTLVEYINHSRIRLVEKYITVDSMTLEEAGALVGIQDPAYLSRLFRRCTGVSVREYRRIYSERREKGINR